MASVPADDGLNPWRRRELLWTLRWLAADPEAAIAAVEGVCIADEIANDLDHWYRTATSWGLLDANLTELVGVIDREFDNMSDRHDPDLWTDDAIRTSPLWATQRSRARAALAAMGEERADDELGQPRQGGPIYIRGSQPSS